jgi:phage gp29-like protein
MTRYTQVEGGLIVPVSFAETAPAGKPETREIATTRDGRDITRGFVDQFMLLAPQDSVLALRGGGNYKLYKEVLRDDQVKAVFEQRRLAVVGKEWEVIPGGDSPVDEEAADFLRQQLDRFKFDALTDKMLYGVFYGYAVAEILWGIDGSRVVVDQVRVRDRVRFGFDADMQPRLVTMDNMLLGEALPERKFWHFANGADHDDEPYGLGLAHWLYWPVFFKRGGIKLWLTFLDKFGAPTAKGEYPTNATPEEKEKLLGALRAITSESGLIVPEGMAIELLEAARSGSASYTELYDRMDRAIAKVVLGQVASSEGTPGKLGNEDTQQQVRSDLIKADADLVCASFNRTVARWLTEFNFPGAVPPQVWRKVEDEEDLNQTSERDRNLHGIGFRPTPERIERIYGEGYEPFEAPAPAPGFPSFAESEAERARARAKATTEDAAQIDDESDALADENWEALLGRRVADLMAFAEESGDYETFRERLKDLAGAPPDDAQVEEFRRIGFIGRLWGRFRADQ